MGGGRAGGSGSGSCRRCWTCSTTATSRAHTSRPRRDTRRRDTRRRDTRRRDTRRRDTRRRPRDRSSREGPAARRVPEGHPPLAAAIIFTTSTCFIIFNNYTRRFDDRKAQFEMYTQQPYSAGQQARRTHPHHHHHRPITTPPPSPHSTCLLAEWQEPTGGRTAMTHLIRVPSPERVARPRRRTPNSKSRTPVAQPLLCLPPRPPRHVADAALGGGGAGTQVLLNYDPKNNADFLLPASRGGGGEWGGVRRRLARRP